MTFRRLNHASKWTRYIYIYIHVHISFHNSVSKSALCTILWCWSVLMVESPCKGFQVDLGIGHTPPERIRLYAVSCYDCKTIKLGLPYYTIRHWIPAVQYTCLRYFKFCCMFGDSKHPGVSGASKTWSRGSSSWRRCQGYIAAAESLSQLGGLAITRGKGGSVDRHWVHQAQEDQHCCTHSELQR